MTDQSQPKTKPVDIWEEWRNRPKSRQPVQNIWEEWRKFRKAPEIVPPRFVGTEAGKDVFELSSGDTFLREKGQSPGIPWDKLDYETQLNDMRSLTIWGKTGTSVGDAWPEHLIKAAKRIVGNSPDVTPEHIEKFIQYMRETGSMSYMQTHPGKPAYTPETEGKSKPNVWAEWGNFGPTPPPELKVVKVPEEEEYKKARQAAQRQQLGQEAKKGLKETLGFLEAPYALATGVTGWLGGLLAVPTKMIYDAWKSGGRDVSFTRAEKAMEDVMNFMAYRPETELGQTLSEIAAAPFTGYLDIMGKGVEKITDDEEKQAALRILGNYALLLLPKFVKGGKGLLEKRLKGAESLTGKEIKVIAKEAPEQIRQVLEKVPDEMEVSVRAPKQQYAFFPKDAPQIWYDVMDVTSGKGIRPFKDAAGKFIEYEEYKSNVPKQLRKKQGLPPDEVADMLGLEDSQALYRELQGKRVTEVEIPEWKVAAEAEEFARQEPIMKTEAEILRKTGKPQEQIAEFLDNTFMDGERLRSVASDVIEGKRTVDDAASEIGDLIESTVRPVRPEGAVPGGTLAYGMELPKYAKSINLERIGADYEAKKFILDIAEIYDREIQEGRRGRISFEETKELADSISDRLSVDELREKVKTKTEKLDSYMTAARDVLNTSAIKTMELAREYTVNPTEENLARFHHSMERHAAIQADVSSGATEVGRALSAHRIMSRTKDWLITKNYKAILKAMGKKKITEEIARKMASLDMENPVQVARFIRDSMPAKTADQVFEVWINSLLSGPRTQAKNLITNVANSYGRIFEKLIAATVEAPKRLIGKEPEVYFGEAFHDFIALHAGMKEGVRRAVKAFLTDMTLDDISKLEVRRGQAIKGIPGHLIRIPSKFLLACDEFFKACIRNADLHSMAYRRATAEGLKGEARATRMADLITNALEGKDKAMIAHANGEALYRTLQKELGRTGKGMQRFRETTPGARWVVPFMRVSINIPKYGFERTPFNFPRVLYKQIKGQYRGAEFAENISRPLFGTAVLMGVFASVWEGVLEGRITGSGPSDPEERQLWYRQGNQPYSIEIGGQKISYKDVEPIGTMLGPIADMIEIWDQIRDEEKDNVTGKLMLAFTENLTNKTFLQGVSNFLDAWVDPDKYAEKWFATFVSTVIPTGVAQVAQAKDPYLRDVRNTVDRIKSRIPGISKELPPRRELWGEPIKREGGFWERLVSPFYRTIPREDIVDNELKRLKRFPGMPQRKIEDIELTPKEYSDFMEVFGPIIHFTLTTLIKSEGYQRLSDDEKKDIIDTTMIQAGKVARAIYKGSHPEILEKWLKKWQKEEEKK